jgi:hypothetical protein
MGKHFIDPKSSEFLSIFQVFRCTTQIAIFWPKLLPALFLKKHWYPCPFEILEETLSGVFSTLQELANTSVIDNIRKSLVWKCAKILWNQTAI